MRALPLKTLVHTVQIEHPKKQGFRVDETLIFNKSERFVHAEHTIAKKKVFHLHETLVFNKSKRFVHAEGTIAKCAQQK